MEYADNGDLYQLISSNKKKGHYINEMKLWSIAIQMIKGRELQYFSRVTSHRGAARAQDFAQGSEIGECFPMQERAGQDRGHECI